MKNHLKKKIKERKKKKKKSNAHETNVRYLQLGTEQTQKVAQEGREKKGKEERKRKVWQKKERKRKKREAWERRGKGVSFDIFMQSGLSWT